MSLIFATQLTAIATAVLALFAIVTAFYARQAFRKQSQEVRDQASMLQVQSEQLAEQRKVNAEQIGVLGLQADELRESLEERKREAELRHRDQAARVFISEEPIDAAGPASALRYSTGAPILAPAITALVRNTSDRPVYDAELRWHRGSEGYGDPNPEPLGTLLPGDEIIKTRGFSRGTNLAVSGAVLTFRDAAGARWTHRPDGHFTEEHLQRHGPFVPVLRNAGCLAALEGRTHQREIPAGAARAIRRGAA